MTGKYEKEPLVWYTSQSEDYVLEARDPHGRTWVIAEENRADPLFVGYEVHLVGSKVTMYYAALARAKNAVEIVLRNERYVEHINGIDYW